jgi:hypothetical protein
MQEMARISIEEVEIDASTGILIRPKIAASEDYEQIYRTASGVRWNREARALVPYQVKGMSASWWFNQIVAAVRSEYGQCLELRPETRWKNVSEEQRREIEKVGKAHAA